ATTLLGSQVPTPLLVAPMAYHRMAHPDGEAASAAGAAAAGAPYLCSTQATMSVEEVAAAAADAVRWFQVYVVRDRGWTAELVERSGLPVVVKGVLRGDDALACLDAGAAGVVVSNHGGRQLDGVVATADALPEVAAAVGDRVEVYVDGGIRHGTDVLKALALG